MAKALELFLDRRTRFGRSIPVLDSPDRISPHDNHVNRRRNHHRGHSCCTDHRVDRNDSICCNNLRRSRKSIHRSAVPERESVWVDLSGSPLSSGNINNVENEVNGNERLPTAVLLARERLLQRLRGVSLSGHREREAGLSISLRRDKTDRPPGLTKEAVESLHITILCKDSVTRECSICLEAFLEGDKLMSLPCGHLFHDACLVPWVQSCGDCPYCRAEVAPPQVV